MLLSTSSFRLAAAWCLTLAHCATAADPCGFEKAFDRPDEQGKKKVAVFTGKKEASAGDVSPFAFVSDLKVNTDGTRISYKVSDPRGTNGGINNILNAMRKGHTIAEFEKLAANDWEPVAQTWQVLSSNVIERNKTTGKPCVSSDGFLVSKTAAVAVANGFSRDGDCDQSKWIDAATIPALVLPTGSQFLAAGARPLNIVVVYNLKDKRLAFGIVGDTGPANEIGEASVEMNRILNGLPEGKLPTSRDDAKKRFQAPQSFILVFPGKVNRIAVPITPQRVHDLAKARFDAWGGEARLKGCLAEIP
jgi:hypothetical protein